jgi:meiotic recombination protein REC8, fungi type
MLGKPGGLYHGSACGLFSAHAFTRQEQLNLAEDPYFIPDLDINFDLSAFGLSSEASSPRRSGSSLLTLSSSQTSRYIEEDVEEVGLGLDLDLPSFSTPAGGLGGFDIPLGRGTSSVARTGDPAGRPSSIFGAEPAVLDDPIFDVDDDGFLHPAMSGGLLLEPELPSIEDQPLASGAAVANEADPDEPLLNFDDDMVLFKDDEPVLPPAAPRIPLTPEPDCEEVQQNERLSSSVHPTEESTETAEALQHRARTVKPIKPDQQTELTNRDLNEWNQNYLANMALALRIKQTHFAASKAKKNAEFWALQQGLGNIASTFGDDREEHPFAIFSGQSLWDMLRGPERGTKRSHTRSEADEQEDEERRVRARRSFQEGIVPGEGDALQNLDDEGVFIQDEEFDIEPEVGRHAPPSLPDNSSGMPWNLNLSAGGSRQSSIRPTGSGLIPGLTSSVGGLSGGNDLGLPSGRSRRGSRLTSASPLFGRGAPLLRQSQGLLEPSRLSSNEDDFADLDAQLGAGLDPDFELYGPSATVDTQTAAQSQWVAATLENEAYNFLTFVSTKIQENLPEEGAEDDGGGHEACILFDELLPPTQNSSIVGAQALLHLLALATKGLLEIHQETPFGDIQISVARR